MKKINKNEMMNITGGTSVYTTAINAILKGISTLFGVGQAVGSSIRRLVTGCAC